MYYKEVNTEGASWYADHFELHLILETKYQQQQINWSLCVASFIIFVKIYKITLLITIIIITLQTAEETILI